jgi:sugar phosphate isomerase/epimerase
LAVYAIARMTFGMRAEASGWADGRVVVADNCQETLSGNYEREESMSISRRDLLKLGAGTCAALATGVQLTGALAAGVRRRRARGAGAAKRVRIGLQLYSVREQCAKDLPGVLAAVAKIGFEGVEFAGYHGRTAQELRTMLDANGLKCCGTHTGWNTLQGDELKKTVEFNKIIGNPYLICPGLPHDQVKSVEAVKTTAKFFTDLAQKVKTDGLRAGYHAHGGDFQKFDGVTVWDILFSNAGPDVCMQLDIGNCLGGGGDPYAILRKFPCRSATIHIKEFGGEPGAPIGEGKVKWNEIFDLCETTGNTEWYIVEHESDPKTPMESVKKCFEGLRKMGKV